MNGAQDTESFARLISALEPWRDQAVIVGGWAHRLYRLHPGALALNYTPLSTLDADIALPARLQVRRQNLYSRLLGHGFTADFLGTDRPPATHYRLGGEASGFYAEFLTPLIGSEYGRSGNRKATVTVAGIVLQQLRHIEILLQHPWAIDFETGGSATKIQIANPVSFLAQKLLIHRKRERQERAKVVLYIHDTLEVSGARLPELRELWRNGLAPQMQPRSLRTVSKAAEALFSKLSDDVRRASEIAAERALAPEAIRAACHYGLVGVFR